MPHSQRTSQKAIVAAAVEIVERAGTEALSMRAVARQLGLAADALHRHFQDRKSLEAAVAAEGTRRLRTALQRAARGTADAEAVGASCRAYLRFARRHTALYGMTMKKYADTPGLQAARQGLRDFFRALFASLEDPRSVQTAGVAAWALLHGMVAQQRDELPDDADLSADSCSALWALVAAFARAVVG
jgi:AcrR family transcriptional regulator